jgi:hypothetical protein
MWQLPQILAAIQSEDLIPLLQREIPAERMPLELFLTHGGWPESPRLLWRGKRETHEAWELLLTVEFTELCPAACPASNRPETRQGYLILRIQKANGAAEFIPD